MELILHWDFGAHNFVNKGECTLKSDGKGHPIPKNGSSSVSLKKRLGHKPNNFQQRIVITVPDGKINLGWKRTVENKIKNYTNLLKNGLRPTAFIGGKLYHLPVTRDAKKFSNTLANILINDNKLSKLSIDSIINNQ